MTRSARPFLILFLSLILVAAGAETKRKKGTSTPRPTPAASSKPATTSASKKKTSKPSPTPEKAADAEDTSSTPASATSSKAKSRSTPAPEGSESASKSGASAASKKKKSGKPSPTPGKEAEADESKSTADKAKVTPAPTEPESAEGTPEAGPRGMQGPTVASIQAESLVELHQQPEWVQRLIRDALTLTTQNLGYLFGSADPKSGGMDCSGTIYYLLRNSGYKDVPRDSRSQYRWLWEKGTLRTVSDNEMAEFDHRALRPGDLLFWTGTYSVNADLPISHVMLYLGRTKDSGKPVMWGASDGRTFDGKQRYGVSVFDFKLPRTESKSRFVGYGQLPPTGKF